MTPTNESRRVLITGLAFALALALVGAIATIGWVAYVQADRRADYNWMLYEYWNAQWDTTNMWSNRHARAWSIQRDSNHTCQRARQQATLPPDSSRVLAEWPRR